MKKYRMTVDDINVARRIFCNTECEICPISNSNNGTGIGCCDFSAMYPDKAAELMGLEVVEVTPRLTEQELAICKALGAKWVSRGIEPFNFVEESVQLWSDKPIHTWKRSYSIEHNTVYLLASMSAELFASVHPGDLVNVEELIENEK